MSRSVLSALKDQGKPVNGSRILLLGLAYKPNVDDRESPSDVLIQKVERLEAIMAYNDPYVLVIPKTA